MDLAALRVVVQDTENDLNRARAHEGQLRRNLSESEAATKSLEALLEQLRNRLASASTVPSPIPVGEAVEALMRENPGITKKEILDRLGPDYDELRDADDINVRRRVPQLMIQAQKRIDESTPDHLSPVETTEG